MNRVLRFIIIVLCAGFLWWFLGTWALPQLHIGDPFDKIAHWGLVILIVILVLDAVAGLMEKNFIPWW